MTIDLIFRFIGLIVLGLVGLEAGWPGGEVWVLALGLGGMALGFSITPYLTLRPYRWLWRELNQIPTLTMLAGMVGLVIALVISALATIPLSQLPGILGTVMPVVVAIFLCYLGISLVMLRAGDLVQPLGLSPSSMSRRGRGRSSAPRQLLVDTSAIIDGRIADISHTGFIPGQFVIPRFILQELQHIADSSDPLRRRRGRRGLEMLHRLQKESEVPIQISEADFPDTEEVDAKLVKVARSWHCAIITTDFNLNRVAELEGIQVLNLNDLAASVKPVVLPGEDMEIRIIQEGKEFGQGVGFLDDGTMVVVEGGRRFLNNRVDVVVTRVLQTAVGRMIFAQIKNGASRDRGEKD
ncbi:MAG: PIN/TRAM domain-containing protein [Dehalococcoidia bacterium]